MAEYTAREWSNGDIVTASNLNQIEDGIENASSGGSEPLVVHVVVMTAEEIAEAGITGIENSDVYRLDATSDEIEAAYASGRAVHIVNNGEIQSLAVMNISSNLRGFGFVVSVEGHQVSGVRWSETPGGYAYPVLIVEQASD